MMLIECQMYFSLFEHIRPSGLEQRRLYHVPRITQVHVRSAFALYLAACHNYLSMHPLTPTARLQKINKQYFPDKPLPTSPKRELDPHILEDIEALFALCAHALAII